MKRVVATISLVVIVMDLGLNSAPTMLSFGRTIVEEKSFTVCGTMYNAVVSQCDEDPLITAGMYNINPSRASEHRFIALSRDLLKRWGGEFDYGDSVIVEGTDGKDGTYLVADAMNKRFKNRVDFLETRGTKLYKFDKFKIRKK